MLRPQTYWLKNYDGSINMDYIGRFETLTEDFNAICTALDIQRISLPHRIKGTGEDYREHYDTESMDMISNVYQEEIKLFNYSFE